MSSGGTLDEMADAPLGLGLDYPEEVYLLVRPCYGLYAKLTTYQHVPGLAAFRDPFEAEEAARDVVLWRHHAPMLASLAEAVWVAQDDPLLKAVHFCRYPGEHLVLGGGAVSVAASCYVR